MRSAVEHLASLLPVEARAELGSDEDLSSAIERFDAARRVFPTIRIELKEFLAFVAERMGEGGAAGAAALGELRAEELFLAFGCARGDPAALRTFEARYLAEVGRAVARIDRSPSFIAEVTQALRERLFLGGPEGGPKILQYAGRGPLAGWLRMVALRVALNLKSRPAPDSPTSNPIDDLVQWPTQDPELELIKAQHRQDFSRAFASALQQLPKRERAALRLYLLEGLTLEEIARMHGVNRSTVSRWLTGSRATILRLTREALSERLRLNGSEVDSLLAVLQSQLDVSVGRYLRSRDR